MLKMNILKEFAMEKSKYSVLVVLCLMCFVSLVNAQNKSVFHSITWDEAAALAEKEGKIVFVDAMRKPMNEEAKQANEKMTRDIFKVKEVTDFINKNTIAIQIDMGSEAGKEFAPKLVMNMYPTYGFFMPNGDILGVISPFILSKEPMKLVEAGNKALEAAAVKRQNSRKIAFQNLTLDQAVEQAKKEGKLVFIDAHTAWCQPCVMMEKNVFSLNTVADYYNEHFINVKIDFGKEKELAERFGVNGYPSFIFVNGKGKTVYIAGGYTEEKEFIGYGEAALKAAEGIVFEHGTWQEALNKAKAENKLIFMDCYTSWCGPCKIMAKDVFTDPDVAKFFNEHFVNVKFDMEKGEGVTLKEKYSVHAYPTLNFINAQGELQHCIVGSMEVEDFLKEAQKAIDGKGLIALTKEYEAGNREPEFVISYLKALGDAYKSEDAEKVCLAYFATLDKAKLQEKFYWDLFYQYINDVDSDVFAYVYENRDALCEAIGEKEVRRKIANVWTVGANRFVSGQGENVAFDEKGFKKYIKRLSKADVDDKFVIISDAKMSNAEKLGDWKTYMDLGEERLKEGTVGDLLLYNWGLRIDRECKDDALRLRAAKWLDDAAAVSDERESEGNVGMMSWGKYFKEISAKLKEPWKEK